MMGIIATSPLRAKSRENPIVWVPGGVEKGPRGPFSWFRPFRTEPAQAPTPGPLNVAKEPDPENSEKACFSYPFLTASFPTPFPSRRFSSFSGKRWSKKGSHYIDFFD